MVEHFAVSPFSCGQCILVVEGRKRFIHPSLKHLLVRHLKLQQRVVLPGTVFEIPVHEPKKLNILLR